MLKETIKCVKYKFVYVYKTCNITCFIDIYNAYFYVKGEIFILMIYRVNISILCV